jgi:hypothetical protein
MKDYTRPNVQARVHIFGSGGGMFYYVEHCSTLCSTKGYEGQGIRSKQRKSIRDASIRKAYLERMMGLRLSENHPSQFYNYYSGLVKVYY